MNSFHPTSKGPDIQVKVRFPSAPSLPSPSSHSPLLTLVIGDVDRPKRRKKEQKRKMAALAGVHQLYQFMTQGKILNNFAINFRQQRSLFESRRFCLNCQIFLQKPFQSIVFITFDTARGFLKSFSARFIENFIHYLIIFLLHHNPRSSGFGPFQSISCQLKTQSTN